MTELEYGINVANKFDLLFGDEDPTEALSKAVDAKKKKAEPKGPATSGNVLKEKTARSATGKPAVEGKPGDKKVEGAKDANKAKPAQGSAAKAPVTGGQQQQQQRPPRSAPQGGRPEQQGGKENTSDAQRRPPQPKSDQQRSPAAAGPGQQGPRRFGGPRPEGSAPPRRSAPMDQDFGGSAGPMTGDQEVPDQRTGFGGGRGFRGGSSFRGGRASPRHQYPREQAHPSEGALPSHARGREFERHSGSNKTGVKPVQKREGGGAYNWGSYRDEAEAGAEAAHAPEGQPPVEKPVGEEGAAPAEGHPAVEGQEGAGEDDANKEPQVHEKTLKEWLEEEERNRVRPKFTTRAANEGEPEQKVFQKMRRVQRENANADGMVEVVEYVEVDVDDDSHVPAGGSGKGGRGGPFQLVFAPAARPEGGMRGGPRGGPRGGRGGQVRGGGPRGGGHGGRMAAPPAQDELNFPPLG